MKSTLVRYAEAKTTLDGRAWLVRSAAPVLADIAGAWNLQETKAESDGQSNLLSLSEVKLPNLVHGKAQDDDVGEDGRGRVGNPCSDLVDAMSRELWYPKLLDWDADAHKEYANADDPGHHEGPNGPCHDLEVRYPEYPVVHKQQGELRPAQVEGIEDLRHDEPFRDADDVFRVEEVGVDAHSLGVHGEDESHHNKVPSLRFLLVVWSRLKNVPRGLGVASETNLREDNHPVIPP